MSRWFTVYPTLYSKLEFILNSLYLFAIMRNEEEQHLLPFLFLRRRLRKGGSAMDFKVVIDWKLVVALGGVAVSVIFAVKMDSTAVKEVSLHTVDAFKEYALISNNRC